MLNVSPDSKNLVLVSFLFLLFFWGAAQHPPQRNIKLDSLIQKEAYASVLKKIDSLLGHHDLNVQQRNRLHIQKANVFTLLKLHDSAIYYLDKSLKTAMRIEDSNLIAKAHNNLGILLNQIGRHQEALKKFRLHYDYVMTTEKPTGPTQRSIIANYNMGLTYFNLQELDSAQHYLNKGLSIADTKTNYYAISKIEGLLSEVNFMKGSSWSVHLMRALEASKSINDSIGILKAHLTLSEFYLRDRLYNKAWQYHKNAKTYTSKTKNNDLLKNYYNIKYQLHKNRGETKQSLEALEQFNIYQQNINERNNANSITVFNERFKLYEEQLRNSKKLLASQRHVKNLTVISALLAITLLLIIAVTLFKLYTRHYNRRLFMVNKLNDDPVKGETAELSPEKKKLFKRINTTVTSNSLYLQSDLNLSELAAIVQSNTSYVSKVINLYTGTNFSNFVNKKRIHYAKTLIEATSKTHDYPNFDEISEQAGFNSKTHFYRVFKHITGLTPKEYFKLSLDALDEKE